jgi:alkyl hydroperoxide reductase subunit AhpF
MTSIANPEAPRLATCWTRKAAAGVPELFAGDVVVVGGGSAGAAAALAAARTGPGPC